MAQGGRRREKGKDAVAMSIDTDDVLAEAARWRDAGKGVAIATVVST